MHAWPHLSSRDVAFGDRKIFMPEDERDLAASLLTQHDIPASGQAFRRAYPAHDCRDFDDLLRQIDAAEARQTTDQG